ncbi:MAG: large conductance mechanosensitive channel protein MscL [Candidatus Paceibacterota bacterium]|jgi:large conductance mechanosensitive channel
MINDFVEFVRKQGVVGLAVGFILGGAISQLVSAIVNDLINPLLGIVLGRVGELKSASLAVGNAVIKWGDFLSVLINFVIVAFVVYYGVKVLGLEKLDKPKDKPKQ